MPKLRHLAYLIAHLAHSGAIAFIGAIELGSIQVVRVGAHRATRLLLLLHLLLLRLLLVHLDVLLRRLDETAWLTLATTLPLACLNIRALNFGGHSVQVDSGNDFVSILLLLLGEAMVIHIRRRKLGGVLTQRFIRTDREWLGVEEVIQRQGVRMLVERVILFLDPAELLDRGVRVIIRS